MTGLRSSRSCVGDTGSHTDVVKECRCACRSWWSGTEVNASREAICKNQNFVDTHSTQDARLRYAMPIRLGCSDKSSNDSDGSLGADA